MDPLQTTEQFTYEVEVAINKKAVWIHCSDGSTVARFGIMGVDLHNSVTDQLNGAPECRLCTHNRSTLADWVLFRNKAKEFWNVDIEDDWFDKSLLLPSRY